MSEIIVRRVQELARAARMLAVVGAWLKLRHEDRISSVVREQIDLGTAIALGQSVSDLTDEDVPSMLIAIEMALGEARDLLRNPAHSAGWAIDDTDLLETMGRASSSAFSRILALAEDRPALRDALTGTFLDIGTGVAGIALKAAETCPGLRIEAIDVWKPALAIAERNIAASQHAARIRLADLDVVALEPVPRFTLVWLPTMFMARPVLEQAVSRVAAASRPGAWLVAPVYTRPEDPFAMAMTTLRTLRGGGEVQEPSEIEALMRAHGYVDIETDVAPLAAFLLGRLP